MNKKTYKYNDLTFKPKLPLMIIFILLWIIGVFTSSFFVGLIFTLSILALGWSITFGTIAEKIN